MKFFGHNLVIIEKMSILVKINSLISPCSSHPSLHVRLGRAALSLRTRRRFGDGSGFWHLWFGQTVLGGFGLLLQLLSRSLQPSQDGFLVRYCNCYLINGPNQSINQYANQQTNEPIDQCIKFIALN